MVPHNTINQEMKALVILKYTIKRNTGISTCHVSRVLLLKTEVSKCQMDNFSEVLSINAVAPLIIRYK